MKGDRRVVLTIEFNDGEQWQAVHGYLFTEGLRSQAESKDLGDALNGVFDQLVSRLWRDHEEGEAG